MDKQGGIMQINKQIEVTGMVCGGCEDVIEAAISKIEGVVEVKADYPSSQCTLSFEDDQVSLEEICKT